MNIMLVLLLMVVACGGIGLFVGLKNRAEELRQARLRKLRTQLARGAGLCLLLGCMPLCAQEVVHAAAGTVVEVNAAKKTLTLKKADGSKVSYQDVSDHEPALSLDKVVRQKTVPVAKYSKVGTNVVVLYYGYDTPTVVAVKEIGTETPKVSTGSVAGFDHHARSLTLKTDATEQKLALTDDTIVDTNEGVVKLADYKPSKGDHVRCVTTADSETALLIVPQ